MGAQRQDDELIYDSVGNPTEVRDWRIASEWPAGAKPVTKKAQYDDLNRVSRVDYQFEGGDDTWASPFAAENSGTADLQDPRRAKPSPHVDFAKRLEWQTFEYDWLGNTKKTDDDARGFNDRSLGPITNDAAKPYQLKAADNTTLGGARTGKLETQYDTAGNLARLQVKRNGTCLPAGSACSQVFGYEWDEVGRLSRARRWDVATLPAITDPLPAGSPDADLAFAYDAGDQRVLKTAKDGAGAERHTIYVFESLELRRAVFAPGPGPSEVPDYELSKWTEVPYLYAHGVRLARVAWEEPDVPTVGGKQTHVLLELGDYLGSTSVVLDHATGELVERGTYQAYGGSESDYRPERWKGFREDYRFTGKEDDVEVGLVYFGRRFLSTSLNRWVSADPLAIHGLGADLNVYAYVSGHALKAIDPLGLEGQYGESGPGNVPVEKDDTLNPNEVGHSGGTQQAPHFSEKEIAGAVCGATLGMACAGMSVSADSSGRADLEGDAEQAVAFLTYSPLRTAPARLGGAPAARTAPAPAQVVGKVPKPAALSDAQLEAQLSRIEQQAVVAADAPATEGVLQSSSTSAAKSGGRLGSASTRKHVAQVADEMEARGWEITHGGGRGPEEYLPGPGGARKGSSYPDITATKNGNTLRVNTVDTRADGVTMTTREATNAARIRAQTGEHLLTIPKPKH